jgi:hypothetical protein
MILIDPIQTHASSPQPFLATTLPTPGWQAVVKAAADGLVQSTETAEARLIDMKHKGYTERSVAEFRAALDQAQLDWTAMTSLKQGIQTFIGEASKLVS